MNCDGYRNGEVFLVTIANCKRCGRLFHKSGKDVCPECLREEDQLLSEIRQFLRKYPDSTIFDVADGTQVEYHVIVDFIRDGRLILRDNPNMSYPCERCGAPTMSGRLCVTCSRELANGFKEASESLRQRETRNRPGGGFLSRS